MIMLLGAAMGAQLGATATLYARGTIIRLYFSITMLARKPAINPSRIHARIPMTVLLCLGLSRRR